MVSDHEAYEVAYQDCAAWQEDFTQRLEACSSVEGDKYTLKNRQAKLMVSIIMETFLSLALAEANGWRHLMLPVQCNVPQYSLLDVHIQTWSNFMLVIPCSFRVLLRLGELLS